MPISFEYKPPARPVIPLLHAAAAIGNKDAADHLLSVATDRAPKLSGRMRDSGEVTDYSDLGTAAPGIFVAAVSYGREDGDGEHADTAAYTIKQHEDEDLHHEVGEAGWLLKSMHSEGPAMLALQAEPMRAVLK